jgi:apolipoprotein N-acyltransferase
MIEIERIETLKHPEKLRGSRLPWLWLLIGFLLVPFTAWQTVVPLAAWLAPLFLLRFARTSELKRARLWLIFLAYALGNLIAMRGVKCSTIYEIAAWLIMVPLCRGLFYMLPYSADVRIGSRLTGWARLLVFPLAFTTLDWALSMHRHITTAGSPAYSQADNLTLIQLTSITGMWGVTFLVMWFASTMNELWEHNFDWRPVRGKVGVFAGVLLAVVIFGSVRLNSAASSNASTLAATITIDSAVQGSASAGLDWATFNRSTDEERARVRANAQKAADMMLERTETALRAGAKIVSWQEASVLVLEEDTTGLVERASSLARRYDAFLQISPLVATRKNAWPYLLNESILIDDTGRVAWTYEKTRPHGFENYLVVAGPGRLPLAVTPYGRLSSALCNDMHFPALIRQSGRLRADILIAPYSENPPFESRAVATMRSIENGVSLLRPTGKGISLIADAKGRILGSQDYFTSASGIMISTIPTHGVRTLYSLVGDTFAYLSVTALAFLVARAFLHKVKTGIEVARPSPHGAAAGMGALPPTTS